MQAHFGSAVNDDKHTGEHRGAPCPGAECLCEGSCPELGNHVEVPMGFCGWHSFFLPAREQQQEARAGQEHSVVCLHFRVMSGSPMWQ